MRFFNVHQPFVEREWLKVSIQFWIGEGLVDIEDLNAFWRVVLIYCLQTGDISQERRSREAAKDNN